jgi:cytochrome d ubiquinol oxidase subunit I
VTKRAELKDFLAVLTNNTAVSAFFHVIAGCFLTAGAFLVGISSWHLARGRQTDVYRPSLRIGLATLVLAGAGVALTGDAQGKLMFEQQPMKMASAEALWDTQAPAPFSIFAVGDVEKGRNSVEIAVPRLLSYLAHNNFNDAVPGINDTQRAEQAKYGPGDYRPWIPFTYWSFRWMIGFGMTSAAVGLAGLWLTRRGRTPSGTFGKWCWRIGLWTIAFPIIGNSWGWMFTEIGRQPWVVYGLLRTQNAVSPGVSGGQVLTSLVVFTLLYAALAVVELKLVVKYAKAGANETPPSPDDETGPDTERPLAFAY